MTLGFSSRKLVTIVAVCYGFHFFTMINCTKVDEECSSDGDCDPDNYEGCGLLNFFTKLTCTCQFLEIPIKGEDPLELELEPNAGKVCLGPIGFPCKSHPFKKSTHASCVTGFCDESLDKCTTEESTKIKARSVGVSYMKMGWQNFAVVGFSFVAVRLLW